MKMAIEAVTIQTGEVFIRVFMGVKWPNHTTTCIAHRWPVRAQPLAHTEKARGPVSALASSSPFPVHSLFKLAPSRSQNDSNLK